MTVPTPIHYWKFDENGGTVAQDSIGGAHLTLDRSDCWVPGKVGSAVRFDPNSGVTRAATSLTSPIQAPWTAACWVQRTADTQGAALFSSWSYAVKLVQYETPQHVVGVTFCDTPPDLDSTYSTPLHQWVHLVLVATKSQITLYADGVIKGTIHTTQPFELGLSWFGSKWERYDFASMLLEEVKIWNVALTDNQVGELGNPPPPPPPPPPSAKYIGTWRWQGSTMVISPGGDGTYVNINWQYYPKVSTAGGWITGHDDDAVMLYSPSIYQNCEWQASMVLLNNGQLELNRTEGDPHFTTSTWTKVS